MSKYGHFPPNATVEEIEEEWARKRCGLAFAATFGVAILVAIVVAFWPSKANAMPINQAAMAQTAVTQNTEPAATAPVRALVAELVRLHPEVVPVLMSVGSSSLLPTQASSTTGTVGQGDAYQPLGTAANVATFCDAQGAGLQFTGVAPHSGKYRVVLTPVKRPDMAVTLIDQVLTRGESVHVAKPVEQGAPYKVALEMPAEPDDTASPFSGVIDVTTPHCG